MTDEEFAKLKAKVDAIIEKWLDILDLRGHRIKFTYERVYHTDKYTVAICNPLWQYKTHRIFFYMPSVSDLDSDEELEEDILHELVHILIAPASGNEAPTDKRRSEQDEFATQSVTFALMRAYITATAKEDK